MDTIRRAPILIIVAAIVALAVTASGCTTRVVMSPQGGAGENTVTASGHGEVSATPDEAEMWFGVTRRAADAKKALADASAAAERINAALRKQGIARDDVQTSGVSVHPLYRDRGGKTALDGFEASINVRATVKDLATLGAMITALSKAGADTVSGPSFSISRDAPYRADAIEEAVEDARAQAREMAKAAGRSVGGVVSITSSSVNVPGRLYREAKGFGDAAQEVPIEPGQLDVTADVTVVFELK